MTTIALLQMALRGNDQDANLRENAKGERYDRTRR
jgi:hypothetical protein